MATPIEPIASPQERRSRQLESSSSPSPRIVNGLSGTGRFPPVGWMLRRDTGTNCSGTLIGCDKFLTAAHCAVDPPLDPAQTSVFFQTVGWVGVTSAVVSPHWDPSILGDGDLAILTLSPAVTGIAPALVNNTVKPALLTDIVIAGWGGIGNPTQSLAGTGRGMLRFGSNNSDECEPNSVGVSDAESICFYLIDPLEPAGEETGVCTGDSGGPMFASVPGLGANVLVGATSGAFGSIPGDCQPPITGVHTDVDHNYDWIASQVPNPAPVQCSNLETAAPFVNTTPIDGSLTAGDTHKLFSVVAGDPVAQLRVTSNASIFPVRLDFDLHVRRAATPIVVGPQTPTPVGQCSSTTADLSFESCSFTNAAAGDYWIRIDNPHGHGGDFQVAVAGLDLVPTWTPTRTPTRTATPTITPTPSITPTRTATSTPGVCPPLDVDGDGSLAPLYDGILFLRYTFGFTGTTLTAGALGEEASRDAEAIVDLLSTCGTALDIDGNSAIEPLADGMLFLRYLLGFRDAALVANAVGAACSRCTAEPIETYIEALL
jgi:hypothetical protein